MKYADDLVLLAKEEAVLQGMIERLTEIGISYGMEMNAEITKVITISRQPPPLEINPLAYTDVCETAGLARSFNTQPAVRRNSETNPTSQHNRGMY